MYRLRAITVADRDLVLAWRNSPTVRVNMYTYHLISVDEHRTWFDAALADSTRRLLMCIDDDGAPAGVVTFYDIRPLNRTASWAFYAGAPLRRGIGPQMEILALDYAFGELQLDKLNCEVLSFNKAVVDFHRKHGFRVEGIFRAQYARGEEHFDVYRLAHFRQAWLEQVRPMLLAHDSRAALRIGATHRQRLAVAAGDLAPVTAAVSEILTSRFPGPGTTHVSQLWHFVPQVSPQRELDCTLRILSLIGQRVILTVDVLQAGDSPVLTGEVEVDVVLPESGRQAQESAR
jgi:UDP-4-amino-4,6-dideoxy-N-acetyl-beta-L-altrosamine N-acetyltransferase